MQRDSRFTVLIIIGVELSRPFGSLECKCSSPNNTFSFLLQVIYVWVWKDDGNELPSIWETSYGASIIADNKNQSIWREKDMNSGVMEIGKWDWQSQETDCGNGGEYTRVEWMLLLLKKIQCTVSG